MGVEPRFRDSFFYQNAARRSFDNSFLRVIWKFLNELFAKNHKKSFSDFINLGRINRQIDV